MKGLFKTVIPRDMSSYSEYEIIFRGLYVKNLIIIALPIAGFFTLYNLYLSRYFVAAIVFSLFLFVCALLVDFTRKPVELRTDFFKEVFVRLFLIFFFLYLIYESGFERSISKTPWFLVFPVLIFFSTNIKEALIWVFCVAAVLLYVLFGTDLKFSENELFHLKTRLAVIFVVLCGVAFVTSYLIRSAIKNLFNNQKELSSTNLRLKEEIEDRKQAESRFRHLCQASSEAVVIHSNGEIIHANDQYYEMFGYQPEELAGTKAVPLTAAPPSLEIMTEKIAAGDPGPYQVLGKKKDGTHFPLEIRGRLMKYQGRRAWMGAIRDLTAQKQAEIEKTKLTAQLQQAQKLESVGTLAGGIAHDFNNILMGIQGNVSLMLLNREPGNLDYERLRNIEKQVESGARLTSLLLGYARKGRYEVKPINMNLLIEEACETFGRTKKQIVIHLDLDDELHSIEADPGQMEQILFNLCINAADAMPQGGELTVKTVNTTHKAMKDKLYKPRPGSYVLLTVTDSGMGMDKKTMDRIFDPFFTTKGMGQGTGLGLASAYGIIKSHGGYIDVESELGQGTTFSIYLPMSEKKVGKEVGRAGQVVMGSGTALLVDDEETVRQVGREILETLGYEVILARNGKEAVELYGQKHDEVDIVLLDIVMPNMGGSEAYDRLKEINPEVKVLLLSGYSIDDQATEILERGCNGFIQKPFKMRDLSVKLREILGNK